MRKQAFPLALAVALGVTLLGNVQAQNPAPTPGSKIGIINIQRAIVESEEGKKAQEKLRAEFAPKDKELRAKQEEIEKLRKQLQESERVLSDEARRNLVRQIETKDQGFQSQQRGPQRRLPAGPGADGQRDRAEADKNPGSVRARERLPPGNRRQLAPSSCCVG